MSSTNSRKSLVSLFVYQILCARSSACHHMTQAEILEALEEYPYSLTLDRKAIGRTLAAMEEEELGIHRSTDGAWHEKREDWHCMRRFSNMNDAA